MLLKNKSFLIIFLLGLIAHLYFATFPGYKFDVDAWFAWALRLADVGLPNFYSTQIWTNYTPGFLYVLYSLGLLKNFLSIPDTYFYLLLKIPGIIAELVLGLLVYRALKPQTNTYWANIGASLILLNPAFIFNSSIWGQIDGLLTLCLFLSIYFLNKQKLILASVMIALAFLIKPQAVALFPVFGLFLIKNFNLQKTIKLILPGFLLLIVGAMPFFLTNLAGLVQLFLKMFGDYPYNSMFAYNFWGIFGFWIPDNHQFFSLAYNYWGYLLLIIYWGATSYLYLRNKLSLWVLAALALLSFYFIPTRAHERYLYPGLALVIFISIYYRRWSLIIASLFLTLIHLLNLYYVYTYYNQFYLKLPPVLFNQTLYNLLDKTGSFFSVLALVIFINIVVFSLQIKDETPHQTI